MSFTRIIRSFLLFSYCFAFAMESPTFDWPSSAKPKQQRADANANARADASVVLSSVALVQEEALAQAVHADVKRDVEAHDVKRGMEDYDAKAEAEQDDPEISLAKARYAERMLFRFRAFERDSSVASAETDSIKKFSFDAVQRYLEKYDSQLIMAIRNCLDKPEELSNITLLDKSHQDIFHNPYLIISAYLIDDFVFSEDEKKQLSTLIHFSAFLNWIANFLIGFWILLEKRLLIQLIKISNGHHYFH